MPIDSLIRRAVLAVVLAVTAPLPLARAQYSPAEVLGISEYLNSPALGSALAADATRLLVGAPLRDNVGSAAPDCGAVLIYERQANSWSGGYRLILPPAAHLQAGMHFGAAVAIAGDRMLIGAPGEDVDGKADAGAVYFYRISSDTGLWQFVSRETSGIVQAGQRLGATVALIGSYAAAGAPGYNLDSQTVDTGRVEMFQRATADGNYLLNGHVRLDPADGGEAFGSSVQLYDTPLSSADRLIVGAPDRTVSGRAHAGAVYCYERVAGSWAFRDLLSPSLVAGERVGGALAVSGDYVFVGARGRNHPGGSAAAGAVVVYQRQAGGVYFHSDELFAANPQPQAEFGASVSVGGGGNRLAVGAPGYDGSGGDNGRVYVFTPHSTSAGTVWSASQTLALGLPEAPNDRLGGAVALSGAQLFAAAPQRKISTVAAAGLVRVYGDAIFADGFD